MQEPVGDYLEHEAWNNYLLERGISGIEEKTRYVWVSFANTTSEGEYSFRTTDGIEVDKLVLDLETLLPAFGNDLAFPPPLS